MSNWIARDLKYIWHPFTQMKDCQMLPPILIERGQGIKLYDAQGRFYYDTISSWWCNVHGHNHPKIIKAVKKQLDSLEHVLFAGFTHRPAILLAEKLVSIASQGLTKVFFSDNGSTAVEVALKISFQYWQNIGQKEKRKFVSLDKGYHGDTVGAMSVSGLSVFNEVFSPLFFDAYKVPSPYCYRCPMNKSGEACRLDCLKPLENLLKQRSQEIAGILLEPLVMAVGGMIIYRKDYLERVAALAKQYHVHLMLDEVATAFGRTGKMFAAHHVSIKPDLVCVSKGITSGYLPLGATLVTENIYKAFYADYEEHKTFYHGHTYTANPLSCAAALASLDIFEAEDVLEKIKGVTRLFHNRLEDFKKLKIVGDVRKIGLIGALELVKNRKTRQGFDPEKRVGLEVYKRGLKKNLILRPLGDIIYFFLPLCVKESDLEDILDRAYSVIKSL
ncbi:MAG: adenosylmethionine--8-amino-7-oxononanoate transaminase [Candidatus Omnitrophota bacterium]